MSNQLKTNDSDTEMCPPTPPKGVPRQTSGAGPGLPPVPPEGHEHLVSTRRANRTFVFVGTKPWTFKDGSAGVLLVWECRCQTCKRPFEIMTSPRNWEHAPNFGIARCKQHRRHGGRA